MSAASFWVQVIGQDDQGRWRKVVMERRHPTEAEARYDAMVTDSIYAPIPGTQIPRQFKTRVVRREYKMVERLITTVLE